MRAAVLILAAMLVGCATARTASDGDGERERHPRVVLLLCLFASCHVGCTPTDHSEDDYNEGTPR